MGVIVERLAALILITHRVAGAALGGEDRLVREGLVAGLGLLAALVGEALDIDGVAQEIVEREHVGEGGAGAVVFASNVLEARAAVLAGALAATLVAERPDDNGRVVAVALNESTHVGHVLRLIGKQTVLIHDGDADSVVDLEHGRIRGVVGGPAAVATNGAGGLGAEEIHTLRDSHPYHGEVVVITEAADLEVLLVQEEAFLLIAASSLSEVRLEFKLWWGLPVYLVRR